jgi:hypothetical protein
MRNAFLRMLLAAISAPAAIVATLSLVSGQAYACKADVRGDKYAMIAVNGWHLGDTCKIKEFPAPWNSMLGIQQGPSKAFHWVYEDKQYGYAMFQIGKDGKGRLIVHYTNGKQFDGDTFTSAFQLLDASGRTLGFITSIRGVNARRTGDDVKVLSESPEFWSNVHSIKFYHGRHQKRDDRRNWNVVLRALYEACKAVELCAPSKPAGQPQAPSQG